MRHLCAACAVALKILQSVCWPSRKEDGVRREICPWPLGTAGDNMTSIHSPYSERHGHIVLIVLRKDRLFMMYSRVRKPSLLPNRRDVFVLLCESQSILL